METPQDSKTIVIKSLAIIGFFATVGLLVWLAVQGLRATPGSFASLASIMETINSYRPNAEFTVGTEKSIVNSGETFTLSWTEMAPQGEYLFSYACTNGVRVTARDARGSLESIACDDEFSARDTTELSMSIISEAERFSDVPLLVAYEPENGDRTEAEVRVTVVNATVSTQPTTIITETDRAATETTEDRVAFDVPEAAKPTTPATPTPTVTPKPTPAPAKPVPTPIPSTSQTITYMPISYANGFTDLKISFAGMGSYTNNIFVPVGEYDNDVRGGLKVEVKNIGTKTSEDWTFTVKLPDGTTYTSDKQTGLKPNEKAVFTLGFDFDTDFTAKTATITGSVATKSDTNAKNDSFSWSAKVVN